MQSLSIGSGLGAQARRAVVTMARTTGLTLRVRGASMAPGLADADTVSVAPARMYWPGDVVAYDDGRGGMVIHRVVGYRIGREGLRLVVRGDARDASVETVPVERIIGRAPGGGLRASLAWMAPRLRRRLVRA